MDFREKEREGPRKGATETDTELRKMSQDLTQLLNRASGGDADAREEALRAVHNRLAQLAGAHLGSENREPTLQPTVLINEAYLKLFSNPDIEWGSRGQFFALASAAMKQIAIDYARKRLAEKRGGGWGRITLGSIGAESSLGMEELLDLDAALEKLSTASPRQAKIVEMRFFGGFTNEQIARSLGVSERTVQLDWRAARAWIRGELDDPATP